MIAKYYVVIGLLFFVACKNGNLKQQATFKPYHTIYETPTDQRLRELKSDFLSAIDAVDESIVNIDLWYFKLGDPSEQLACNAKIDSGDLVTLPHRLAMPNTSFWYTREIDVMEKGILAVHADDGAQVFLNGKQIRRFKQSYFPIDTVGKVVITVRVLNNAMSGGLSSVSFLTKNQFERRHELESRMLRRKKLFEKVLLMNHPSSQVIESVERATNQTNEHTLTIAENILVDFPFFTGPWLQDLGENKWSVNLITDSNLPVVLAYGYQFDRLENILQQQGDSISFMLNLQPGRKVYYRMTSGKTVSPVFSFDNRPLPASFNFSVWADSQAGWEIFQNNILNASDYHDAFSVGVGDLVAEGADREQWRMFFNTLGASAATKPYYLIAGNHDYDGYYDDLNPLFYKKYVGQKATYFSWTKGNCAFIALDPNQNFPIGVKSGSQQYAWLRQQLKSSAWKEANWRFVLLHQPPYSQGWFGYEGDKNIRDLLDSLIESAKIDFIISGHTHDYERLTKQYGKQEVTFLIVGGAGGSLEPPESSPTPQMDTVIKSHHIGRFYVQDRIIKFEAINHKKQIIDSFQRLK